MFATEKKTNCPRCDVAMANHWKHVMGKGFRCKHIGHVVEAECWHCGCFIVRGGCDARFDEHLRFDRPEHVRQCREHTKELLNEMGR